MKAYTSYFDRQTVSPRLHQQLLELEVRPAPQRGNLLKFGTLAACMALLLAIGSGWLMGGGPTANIPIVPPAPTAVPDAPPTPVLQDTEQTSGLSGDHEAFLVRGPGEGLKFELPAVFVAEYADVTGQPQVSRSLAYHPGDFAVPLTKEDIQKIFWGSEGKPPVANPKTDTGDFPLLLMKWQGYTVCGSATYDGAGDLYLLTIQGEKGEDSFTLRLCPGRLPPSCCVLSGLTTTDVLGTEVTGWRGSYDQDGDGKVEHVVSAQLMVGGYGMEFENIGSGGIIAGEKDGGEATELGGAVLFNAMFVNHVCRTDGGLYLDHLLRCETIPDWKDESYKTIDAALSAAAEFAHSHPGKDFTPYLPTEGPEGYGDFHSHLSYQEGSHTTLFVRWSRGYDDVEVDVLLPEGRSTHFVTDALVDVTVPESYDWRLYDGPICDNVPAQYQLHFYKPAFRAEDMTPEVVKARMSRHDTGGEKCLFYVLHGNGAVVGYSCDGVSPEYIWSLVEPTLK